MAKSHLTVVEPDAHASFSEIRQRLAAQACALRGFLTIADEIDSDEAGLIPSDVAKLLTPVYRELRQLDDELRAIEDEARARAAAR